MATPIRTTPIEDALIARASGQIGSGQGADWFGPGEPLAPQAPPQVKGRQFDYPFAVNLSTRPRQEQAATSIPFETLQQVADPTQGGLDLLRLAIQTVKYQMGAQKWTVRSTDPAKARARGRDPRAEEIKKWLRKPDGITPWITWMWQVVEDHLVIDAPTIYPRQARKKMLLEVIDGSTIKRVLDENGRTPLPPFPAYQQRLKGLPAVDYRLDELIYAPANLRPGRIYGMSPVEQVVGIVNIALRRQLSQLHYYTEGNVPEALVGTPESWNPDQVKDFQNFWDTIMEGNSAARRHMKFVPGGMQPTFTRDPKLKDEMDEWLSRIICYCFNLSPQALVKEVNRATAETSKRSAQEEGTEVTKLWFKTAIMDEAFERAGIEDYEFAYLDEEITDPEVKAKVYQMALGGKPWMTPDEVREVGYSMERLTDEQKEELNPTPPALVDPSDPAGKPGAKPGTTQGEAKGRSSASASKLPPAPGAAKKPSAKPEPAEKLAKAKPQKKKTLPSIDRDRPVLTRASKRIAALFKGYFRKQRKALLAAVQAKAEKMAKMSLDDMEDLIGSLQDEKERSKLQRGLENLLGAVGEDGAEAALSQVLEIAEPTEADLDAMLSQANEKAVEWAEARAAELVTEVDETTMDNIRSLVGQALEDGLSNDELADLIQQSEGFSDYRSEMIARTETAFADVQGNLAGWKETGVVESKKWIVAQDEVCDECHALDGVVVGLDEDFPGEGGDGPPLHPNCRCDIVPVITATTDEE